MLFETFFLIIISKCLALEIKNVAFVIISQENSYHARLAENLKNDLKKQSENFYSDIPQVYLTHKDFSEVEGWTIFPLIPILTNLHRTDNVSWIFFLEDRTKIYLNVLLKTLNKYDHNKEIWIGYALNDKEATIIHHFSFFKNPYFFKYPNVASGFAITVPLLKRLSKRINQKLPKNVDFNIDISHEFALFIWDNGDGPMITHEELFCSKEKLSCATLPIKFQPCDTNLVSKESIYFAVKTCQKFHKDRVQVVIKTWGQYAKIIKFFSDISDKDIPTINLGIPNTEQGHCAKTLGILKYISKDIENHNEIKWVIVTDDDTLLSVSRLQQLLSCYNSEEYVALGERYRYNGYSSHHFPNGYNYITGGGAMAFSRTLVEKLVQICHCPSPTTPDDMFLGMCIASLGVSVTHSPYFHQARPADYAPGYLDTKDAISFHKHWMIDPVKVYKQWFENSENKPLSTSDNTNDNNSVHNEL